MARATPPPMHRQSRARAPCYSLLITPPSIATRASRSAWLPSSAAPISQRYPMAAPMPAHAVKLPSAMESTQTQTPAQAAVSALEMRAQNGEKVTAKELAEARAALDLEGFAAQAKERAEVAQRAKERADRIADLNKRVEAIKAEETLKVAREKLAAALEEFGSVCGDYEDRRKAIIAANSEFMEVEGDETLKQLRGRARQIEEAKMKTTVYQLALDKLKRHYDRRDDWERVE